MRCSYDDSTHVDVGIELIEIVAGQFVQWRAIFNEQVNEVDMASAERFDECLAKIGLLPTSDGRIGENMLLAVLELLPGLRRNAWLTVELVLVLPWLVSARPRRIVAHSSCRRRTWQLKIDDR